MSEDPIGFDGGDENFYRYVENRPVYFRDPTGNEACVGFDYGFHAYITIDEPNKSDRLQRYDLYPSPGNGLKALYSTVPGRIYKSSVPKSEKPMFCDGGDGDSDQKVIQRLVNLKEEFKKGQKNYNTTGIPHNTMNCWGMVMNGLNK